MKDEKQERFNELDAARVLGDWTPDEQKEFEALLAEGFEPDGELDWIAAGLETALVPSEDLSRDLEQRLLEDARSFGKEDESLRDKIIPFAFHPVAGWAAAACLMIAFSIFGEWRLGQLSPESARKQLAKQGDLLELPFAGTERFSSLTGDVRWSDEKQEGYLSLSGLTPNNPKQAQYQLWIVDPERDSAPVDGGVFNIPKGEEVVTIPIQAALEVRNPVAFVITQEKPGGVVVSKQEVVAAIAQQS